MDEEKVKRKAGRPRVEKKSKLLPRNWPSSFKSFENRARRGLRYILAEVDTKEFQAKIKTMSPYELANLGNFFANMITKMKDLEAERQEEVRVENNKVKMNGQPGNPGNPGNIRKSIIDFPDEKKGATG